jgi:hypothetical protein
MTDQHPTRFENYPPPASADPLSPADPAPTTPPELYLSTPTPPAQPAHSRRGVVFGLIALVVGGPVVAQVGWGAFGSSTSSTEDSETWGSEPFDEPTEFTAGEYTGPIPTGWELTDDGGGDVAVLRNGTNQVTVQSWAPESERLWPPNDITEAVNRAATGFKGTLGKPVNESTGTRAMATLSGKGTFEGAPAREFAELWLDDSDTYLLIITLLTAEEGSPIARQATDIAWNLTSGLR